MNCLISVLIICVLLFNITLNCISEVSAVREQAITDAKTDFQEGIWTLLGMMAPMGCCLGYAVASTIDPEPDVSHWITMEFAEPNDTQYLGARIGTVAGFLSLPLVLVLAPINPPAEQLLGKTPEYVDAYTQKYKSETQILRLKHVGKGLALGTGLGCLLSFLVAQSY